MCRGLALTGRAVAGRLKLQSGDSPSEKPPTPSSATGIHKFLHVDVIMQENRFIRRPGWFRLVRGRRRGGSQW